MASKRVVVVEYDPAWPQTFEAIRDRVAPAVDGVAIAIEHVGSTSVPGLCAKPILDIDVIVRGQDVAEAIARLAPLGYEHQGDLGVPKREAFRNREVIAHNLYVCVDGATQTRNHFVLRDALRADPALAREYCELKRALAQQFPNDIDAYIAGKSVFVMRVLESSGRFSTDELVAIRAVNEA